MKNWTQSTDVSFIRHESSASETSYSPTTARIDTLAEQIRGAIMLDQRAFVVPIEAIDFETLK